MFWGLSESLDLFEEYINSTDCNSNDTIEAVDGASNKELSLNILLYGSNDPRHVITTIANIYKHKQNGIVPTIKFYIVDGCMEVVARNIILLAIALENPEKINLHNKVGLFMDIYGNSLIRPSSDAYVAGKAKYLLEILTDETELQNNAPFISFDNLKYRDRDGLENAFYFWTQKDGHIFDIQKYWCDRLRKLAGTRYDYRDGIFDWDLNMTLKDRGAQQLCCQEYRYWRETGIAFTYPEFEYSKSNKTLSAGLIRNGNSYIHRGYVGDIQSGPYAAFGLKTTEEKMMKSQHGENDYRSTDITERNLLELFYELINEAPYEHDLSLSRKYGAVRLQMGKSLLWNEDNLESTEGYFGQWLNLKNIQINFMSREFLNRLQNTQDDRWKEFFDVAFVSYNYFQFVKDPFIGVLRPNSLLLMETNQFTVGSKESLDKFEMEIKEFAKRNNLSNCTKNSLNLKYKFLKFKK